MRFFLKTLEFFELSSPHSTVLLTPTVKGLFRDLNFPDRINACQPLTDKHLNLAQFCNDLFRTMSLDTHYLILLY